MFYLNINKYIQVTEFFNFCHCDLTSYYMKNVKWTDDDSTLLMIRLAAELFGA